MKKLRSFFLLGLVFFQVSPLFAQPGVGDPTNGNPTPISGIEILLLAGAALGVRRLYTKNKKQN